MGGKTLAKQLKQERQEQAFLNRFAQQSQESKLKAQTPPIPLEEDIKEYRAFFWRDPAGFILKTKSSNRIKQRLELVRHVFQRYSVPNFMEQAWGEIGPTPLRNPLIQPTGSSFDFKQWYICIAQGGSLYKQHLKDLLTKKETHLFLNCRHQLSIPQTLVFAIGRALDVPDGMALRVARSKIVEKPLDEFWKHAIRFFAQEPSCTIAQIDDLIDYLDFKHRDNAQFALAGAGHTLTSLTKKMHDWHYDLRRLKAIGEETWNGFPLPDSSYERKDDQGRPIHWDFRQIKTAKTLQQEGNAQRHCVFGYKGGCIRGDHSIWSLVLRDSTGEHRKVTIELRNDRTIAQMRGLANRTPYAHELHIIKVWANQYQLSL